MEITTNTFNGIKYGEILRPYVDINRDFNGPIHCVFKLNDFSEHTETRSKKFDVIIHIDIHDMNNDSIYTHSSRSFVIFYDNFDENLYVLCDKLLIDLVRASIKDLDIEEDMKSNILNKSKIQLRKYFYPQEF